MSQLQQINQTYDNHLLKLSDIYITIYYGFYFQGTFGESNLFEFTLMSILLPFCGFITTHNQNTLKQPNNIFA
jgi:hypothetical protein